jgi:hypothetical protein
MRVTITIVLLCTMDNNPLKVILQSQLDLHAQLSAEMLVLYTHVFPLLLMHLHLCCSSLILVLMHVLTTILPCCSHLIYVHDRFP